MALTKEKKVAVIAKLKEIVAVSPSIVFVNFHGLSVPDTGVMRGTLRERGVSYVVAKKTLIKRALSEANIGGSVPELHGEIAIAYSGGDDPVTVAGGIYEFVKKFKNSISILGGIFEKRYLNKDEMMTIATIPPMPILRGQFANVINSPIQGLVVALGQIAEKKN